MKNIRYIYTKILWDEREREKERKKERDGWGKNILHNWESSMFARSQNASEREGVDIGQGCVYVSKR